jgi:predicted ATPase
MIRQLRIKNFKGWSDTGTIRMAPLTVFFGANSSGKSSIGHLLLALKQTVDNQDRKTVIFPGDSNSPIQFGSLQDLIYHRNAESKIEFDYLWDLAKPLDISDARNERKYRGTSVRFSASIGLDEQKMSEVDSFKYELLNGNNKDELVFSVNMSKTAQKASYTIDTSGYNLVKTTGRPWSIGSPARFYGFPETVVAYYQNAEFVQSLNLLHEHLFESVFYLGPMRSSPLRLYHWSGDEPDSVGFIGERTINAILSAQNRMLSTGKGKKKAPFLEIIARKLKEMGLIESFLVEPIAKGRQSYEVKVRTKGSTDMVDLPDVGFGVSQVLPVLVQLFYAPANSIIIMEQPEIHLHPSAQAALADVMIDAIMSWENGEARGIQLIIETHSEHFLRRLQRRIAEDVMENDHLAAYFANTGVTPAKLESLKVDKYGNISNWPKAFFGDEMGEIAAQSLAAIQKRSKEV